MSETTTTDARDGTETRRVDRLAPEPPRQAGAERFDEAIVVTRTRSWIGLAACLALVVGLVVWASTAKVDTTIESPGVALENGAVDIVHASATGTVSDVRVGVGEQVGAEQVLARIVTDNDMLVEIRAPIPGTVLSVVDPNAPVAAGDDAFTLVPETGPDVVRTLVTSAEAQVIKVGTPVLLEFPGVPEVDGHVYSVGLTPLPKNQVVDDIGGESIAAEALRKNARTRVDITVDKPELRLPFRPSSIGRVTLILGSRHPIQYVL